MREVDLILNSLSDENHIIFTFFIEQCSVTTRNTVLRAINSSHLEIMNDLDEIDKYCFLAYFWITSSNRLVY